MQRELHDAVARAAPSRRVRCIVLTGAGEKAFCTGIDRMEQMGGDARRHAPTPTSSARAATPFMFNDPGDNIGPKSCDLWKPVIAAVNGMACGGAFYMLGEVEFIIAAEHATFFDPHVTYGMTAAFEPIHMAGHHAVRRDHAAVAAWATTSACRRERAYQIGMVSEVVPGDRAARRARTRSRAIIASQPKLAIEGTVRAIWGAREFGSREAVRLGYAYVAMGTNQDSIAEGQKLFASGKRMEWKLR